MLKKQLTVALLPLLLAASAFAETKTYPFRADVTKKNGAIERVVVQATDSKQAGEMIKNMYPDAKSISMVSRDDK